MFIGDENRNRCPVRGGFNFQRAAALCLKPLPYVFQRSMRNVVVYVAEALAVVLNGQLASVIGLFGFYCNMKRLKLGAYAVYYGVFNYGL